MIRKNLANIITSTRIIGSLIMFFVEPLSSYFFLVYIYSGISDALDGYIARSTNTTSELGSKLDSISDLLFYTVMMIKMIPFLLEVLPSNIWYMINGTLVLRVSMYLYFGIKEKQLMSNHTLLNKLTGLLMFLIPFMLMTDFFVKYAFVVASIAILAAIYELVLMVKRG